jgi:RsiW-degrading membrane proteinase PrsW (M82 family)
MSILTAIVAAAIPTAIYSMLLWWLDRYEKEPLWLIVVAFLWGALPAIALALLFELLLAPPFSRAVISLGLVPVIEELVKGLALIGLFLFARQEFDGPLDGIVYGALVGFGFSMTENILDFMRSAPDLVAHFWVRGVFLGLDHAFFTSLTGLALGAVRYRRDPVIKVLAYAGGLSLAIFFHALHNFVDDSSLVGFFFAWLIQAGGVIVVLAVAVLAWRNERRWLEQELNDEVRAGVLTARDYDEVISSFQRLRGQLRALLAGGWGHYRSVRRLYQLATELAFRKSQLRLDDGVHSCAERDQLRQDIVLLRERLQRDAPAER